MRWGTLASGLAILISWLTATDINRTTHRSDTLRGYFVSLSAQIESEFPLLTEFSGHPSSDREVLRNLEGLRMERAGTWCYHKCGGFRGSKKKHGVTVTARPFWSRSRGRPSAMLRRRGELIGNNRMTSLLPQNPPLWSYFGPAQPAQTAGRWLAVNQIGTLAYGEGRSTARARPIRTGSLITVT